MLLDCERIPNPAVTILLVFLLGSVTALRINEQALKVARPNIKLCDGPELEETRVGRQLKRLQKTGQVLRTRVIPKSRCDANCSIC